MSSDGVAANGTSAGDAASVDASMGNANGHSDTAIDDSFSETQNVSEEDKYWKNVHDNSTDFTSWTYLISLVEKQGDIEKIRKVYDGFLVYFPLCFFYWKKYADHEVNKGDVDKALEVYERGVHGIHHSVDLWTYYCNFVSGNSGDVDLARSLWERGAAAVGTDFASHPFWDKYIEFETSQEAFPRVAALYLRILQTPLDQLAQYHNKFKTFVNSRPLSELLLPNEVVDLEAEKKKHEQKYNELAAKKEGEAMDPSEASSAGIKNGDEVEVEFRARVMANREEMYKKTLEDVTKRRTFEFGVTKRPYFHVKPLDESMLSNWRKYLDMEERESTTANPDRVVKLYERCLVAACYYSEFWLRYVKWLEAHRGVEAARAAFVRATTIFLLRRADIHLEYALFEEVHGDAAKARQIYESLASTLPGHVESTLRFVNFERRHHKYEEACSIFETALRISSLDAKSGPFLSMQYGLFLERVLKAPERVREMYERTLQKFPEHKGLWMAFIHFESAQGDADKVIALYARVVAEDSKLTADERVEMWHNYLEYAADWVNNPATVRKLQETFRTLYPAYSYKAETAKKRPLPFDSHATDPSSSSSSSSSSSKVPRTTPAATAATPAATVAATAAYNPAAAAQYPYQQYAQYGGYTYPTGYTYPYAAAGGAGGAGGIAGIQYPITATATGATGQYPAAGAAGGGGYSAGYGYPYGYTQTT